jgi:hypothetical protein
MAKSCQWLLVASLVVPGCALDHEPTHPTDSVVVRGAMGVPCMGTEITTCIGCDHPGCCLHFCQDGAWTECSYAPRSCVEAGVGLGPDR